MARVLPINETNSVRPRDIAFYRETMQQEILPRIAVLDIITHPPLKGALAYDTGTNLLYYGTGVAWIPLTIGGAGVTLATVGGMISLVVNGVGPNLTMKGLSAGANITLIDSPTAVTIAYSGLLPSDVTLLDAGTIGGHASLVNDGVGPDLAVKGLVAGTNITFIDTATDLTINTPTITLASAGGANSIVNDGVGPALVVKGFTAGPNISIGSSAIEVMVSFTGSTGDDVTLSDAGTIGGHASLVNDGIGPTLAVKGLTVGSSITLVETATDITIDAPITLSSAGGVISLVNDPTGPALAIKGLTSGANIAISNEATQAQISFTGSTGDDVTLSDAGVLAGHQSLVVDGTGPPLSTVGAAPGEGMLLQTVGTDVVFNSEQYAYKTIVLIDSPYSVTTSDRDIGVQTLTGAITINLPLIATLPLNQRKRYEITDADGNASVNFITINPAGGDFIGVPGGAPILVNADYTTISMYSDTVNTWYLY